MHNESWHLSDLPGYGYCRKANINEWIFKRKSIRERDWLNTVAHNCELLKGLFDVCLSCISSSLYTINTLLCQCAMLEP